MEENTKQTSQRSRKIDITRQIISSLAAIGIGVVVILLIKTPERPISGPAANSAEEKAPEVVKIEGPQTLSVTAGTPLEKMLAFAVIKGNSAAAPHLSVTGAVVARVGLGTGNLEDRWRFQTPDLVGTHSDWLKATSDVKYAQTQLENTKNFSASQITRTEAQLMGESGA